ncbi:MAG: PQQ-binding-like beta-propeller repeat protein [Phycisphaerales bacterium]
MSNGSNRYPKFSRPEGLGAACVVCVLGASLAGCASGQTTPETAAKPAPKVTTLASDLGIKVDFEDWKKLGYRLDWVGYADSTNRRGAKVSKVATFEDIVVALSSDSTVTVLEASTGKRRWSTELSGPLTRFVGIARDPADPTRLFVISESELFVLSTPTGNLADRQRFERVVNTAPIIVGGTLVFGTTSGEVYAHDTTINTRAWGFISDASFEGNPVMASEVLGMVSQKGDTIFLSPEGRIVGRQRIYGGVATNPVSNGKMLIIAGLDQSLWGFDPFGSSSWRYRTSVPLRVQPSAAGDRVYCEVAGEGLLCFDAETGAVNWRAKDARGTVFAERAGKLLSWSEGEVFQLDPQNGDIIERVKTPGMTGSYTTDFVDGLLYVTSDTGAIAKFSAK